MQTPASVHEYNADAFKSKTVRDLGAMSSGQPGPVNIVWAVPGMGVITAIREAGKEMGEQAGVQARVIEWNTDAGLLMSGNADFDAAQVLVIDMVASTLDQEQTQKLAEFIQERRKDAAIWVVGQPSSELEKAIGPGVARFVHTVRSWAERLTARNQAQGQEHKNDGPKL